MPFIQYKYVVKPGEQQYTFVREIGLAGDGPLKKCVMSQNKENRSPFCWHATINDILKCLQISSDKNCILIDLMPNDKKAVSLYRLCEIWGFYEDEWTPIALCLQSLFVEEKVPDPITFKKSFVHTDKHKDNHKVGEFLYLRGGVKGGSWNWGRIGYVNGTLLWKDAFAWLAGELGKELLYKI